MAMYEVVLFVAPYWVLSGQRFGDIDEALRLAEAYRRTINRLGYCLPVGVRTPDDRVVKLRSVAA